MKLEGKSLKADFLRFIIPSIIAQWVFTLYTMIDGIFVARGVSEVALTAVNLSLPFVTGLFSLAILFAVGTSTVVAIMLGEKKTAQANQVFTQNMVVLSVISIFITIAVLLNLEQFSYFLGANENTIGYVKEYVGTIAPFSIFFILSYSFEILIKTDGFPKKATIIVCIGAVTNCILDYVFVMLWDWGVTGAAVATGISQVAVIFFYTKHFLGRKGTIKFAKFKLDIALVVREFKNGFPAGVTEFSAGIIIFLFNQAILKYIGDQALVSYTIISYINNIVIMSMAGIAQGFQPLVSYYYGKQQMQTCKKLFRYGLIASSVLSIIVVIFCFVGTNWIVSLFIKSTLVELTAYSVNVFRIFSISFLIAGFNVVVGGYFTAIEKPIYATVLSLARGFVIMLLSLLLVVAVFGGEGIWWAASLSEGICVILSISFLIIYKRSLNKVV